jgi:glycosyltransferase involved in cell wall biosynthesis
MKRVLLVQPSLQPPGGGNAVGAWVLQALAPQHRVTVLTWQPVEVEPINRFFGTALRRRDFDAITVPAAWRRALDAAPMPATLLKLSLLMRHTRAVGSGYDVVFGVHNEMDFGRRGIQYVHFPTYLRPRPDVDLRWYHRPRSALTMYYRVADALADFSVDRLKENLTLVNSDWTGTRVAQSLGVATRTLYPPVVDPPPGLPWKERRHAFLAIGRLSPEKEYERGMEIIARVRRRIPDVTLTIVGTWDKHSRTYADQLREHAARLGSWITFKDNLTRDEVSHLMGTHRYGIHCMREEHFGMAPAEMARAGCIVWVSNGGGQVEIVDRHPRLTYDGEDDAVDKIVETLSDGDEQTRLRAALQSTERFSTTHFVEHVRDIVDEFRE